MASAPVAWPRGGPPIAALGERLYRDHAVRPHQVRGRQNKRLCKGRPAAAHFLAAALALRLHPQDLLRRGGRGALPGGAARRRRPARHLRAFRAPDHARGDHRSRARGRRAAAPRSRRGRRQDHRPARRRSGMEPGERSRQPAANSDRAAPALLRDLQARPGREGPDRGAARIRGAPRGKSGRGCARRLQGVTRTGLTHGGSVGQPLRCAEGERIGPRPQARPRHARGAGARIRRQCLSAASAALLSGLEPPARYGLLRHGGILRDGCGREHHGARIPRPLFILGRAQRRRARPGARRGAARLSRRERRLRLGGALHPGRADGAQPFRRPAGAPRARPVGRHGGDSKMMDGVLAVLSIAGAITLGAMSPGPSFILVARTSVARSRADGLAMALAMGAGGVLFAVLALAGVHAVLATVPVVYEALKVLGGIYLVYLAWMLWRHAAAPIDLEKIGSSSRRSFRLGLATQVSNPKTAVVYATVFVSLLPKEVPLWAMLVLPVLIFCIEAGWYSIVALALSSPAPAAAYLRWKRWIDRAAGTVMGVLGFKLIFTRLEA